MAEKKAKKKVKEQKEILRLENLIDIDPRTQLEQLSDLPGQITEVIGDMAATFPKLLWKDIPSFIKKLKGSQKVPIGATRRKKSIRKGVKKAQETEVDKERKRRIDENKKTRKEILNEGRMKSLTPGRKSGGKVQYRSIGGKVSGNDVIKMIYD